MASDEFPIPEDLEEGLFMGTGRKEVPGLPDGVERAPDGRDLIVERRILQRLDEVLAELVTVRGYQDDLVRGVGVMRHKQEEEGWCAHSMATWMEGIADRLDSNREMFLGSSMRGREAFEETGRKLEWLLGDSREMRRRIAPAGGRGSGWALVVSGCLTGFLLAGVLLIAVGVLEMRSPVVDAQRAMAGVGAEGVLAPPPSAVEARREEFLAEGPPTGLRVDPLRGPEARDDRFLRSLPDNPGVWGPVEGRRGEEPVLPGKGP